MSDTTTLRRLLNTVGTHEGVSLEHELFLDAGSGACGAGDSASRRDAKLTNGFVESYRGLDRNRFRH